MKYIWHLTIEACQGASFSAKDNLWFDTWIQTDDATDDSVVLRLAALSNPSMWQSAASHSANIQQHYSPDFATRFTPDQYTALLTVVALINPLDDDDDDDLLPELITVGELHRLCDPDLEDALASVLMGDWEPTLCWIHSQGWQMGGNCRSH
jgi:hypothetical protein